MYVCEIIDQEGAHTVLTRDELILELLPFCISFIITCLFIRHNYTVASKFSY